MHRPERLRIRWRAGRGPVLAAWALGVVAAGCSQTGTSHPLNPPFDPIYGVVPPPPGAAPPHAPPAPAPTPGPKKDAPHGAADGLVPPIPAALSATNNASLAGSSVLPGGKVLAIPASNPAGPTQANSTPGDWNLPANPNPRVVPVPRDTGAAGPAGPGIQTTGSWVAADGSAPARTPAAPAAPVITLQTFGPLLQQRGFTLRHQEQKATAGGIHLTCWAAPNASLDTLTVFEVTAPDFPTAAQAILRDAEHRTGK